MHRLISAITACAALFAPMSARAQTSDSNGPGQVAAAPAPAKPLTTCEALARDWRNVEIDLAKSDIEDVGDNSAPRSTMRAIRDGNSLQLASMTLSLMRDYKCSLPKRAPSSVTFMLPAMECRTEQLKGNYKAPQCETANWYALGQ